MSQATVVLPTSGVVSGATYAADNNAALDAVRTAWSGATAPATDTPEQGQWWLDTSQVGGGNFPILRQYDGAQWAEILVLDTTNHMMWSPSGPIATTTGTGAAYLLSTAPYAPAAAPAKGFAIQLIVHTANTGACTIDVNGIGAHPLRSASGVEIPAGALVADSVITITYLSATTEWIVDGFLAGSNPVPPGTISKFAGFTAPSGYLFCNGAAINRVTFANLKTAITIAQTGTLTAGANTCTGLTDTSDMQVGMPIEATHLNAGTTIASITSSTAITVSTNATAGAGSETVTVFPWGNGNGTTTLNTPDLRGVGIVGSDTMGTTAANVGQVSTNITTTITSPTATVASATGLAIGHKIVSTNVPYGTTITNIVGTTITMSQNATASAGPTPARFSPFADAQISGSTGGELVHTSVTAETAAHNHSVTDPGHGHNMVKDANPPAATISVGTPVGQAAFSGGNPQCGGATISVSPNTTGISIQNAGGGLAHNTVSPNKIMKFIIKT